MTAPVTMMEEPLDGDANRYQMCFYIPAAHQLEPPKPTDPNVYIEVRPRLTGSQVRVAPVGEQQHQRTFGGWVSKMREWVTRKDDLERDLKAAGEQGVDYTRFYGAGYDSPMKYKNRERGVVRRGPVRTAAVLVPPRRRRPRAGRDGAAPEGLRRRFRIAASGMTTFCTCKILL
ncbi:Heme-binding protein 2 [Penaeus vannamei]|uniref:Heme-binding protein 2 n=1 Tax=Penaeus vannamei TaxID=6689 RepID=A0A3R7LRX9_PENVA|nr:Heme-binding protein 2 [Penaeus vannamei]